MEPTLDQLQQASNANFLTRLRGRLIAAALRANAAEMGFRLERDTVMTPYERRHLIAGAACTEVVEEDMGVVEAMDGSTPVDDTDMARAPTEDPDAGRPELPPYVAPDMGEEASSAGSSDDGGCASAAGSSPSPVALLGLFCLSLFISRRRRALLSQPCERS